MTRGRAMRRAAGAGGALPERPLGGAPRQASLQPRARARSQSKQQAGEPVDSDPEVFFLRVRLEDTGEVFRVSNCRGDTTVRELREDLDLIVGIPFNLQRLHYLDQGDMTDDGTLKFHDVVPGGVISLSIWHYDGWIELVLAAVEGDLSKLSCLGITEDSFYRTANSRSLEGEKWKRWTSQRAFVALYIASHRGHCDAVRYLLEQGTSFLDSTPLGRTPLHVAVAMGRLDCMKLLLEHGAPIQEKDAKGETPISIARCVNRKLTEQRLFLLYWLAKGTGKTRIKDLILRQVFQRMCSSLGSRKTSS
ncbi:ankyrin repeat domain-containing protein 60 [Urocitellus parryii]